MSPSVRSHEPRDPDTFDIRATVLRIGEAARCHRRLILSSCVAALALTTLYALVWPPVYDATATVMVERDTDPVRDSFYVTWNVFRKDDARTEIELMTSGPVLREVVARANLKFEDVHHPVTTHVAYLWGISPVGRAYRWVKRQVLGDPYGLTPEELERVKTVVALRSGISIAPVAESNVGRLTVKGPSPRVSEIANTLLDVYLEYREERHFQEAQTAYELLTEQTEMAELEVNEIERERLSFTTEHGLVFDFQKDSLFIDKLADLEGITITQHVRIAEFEGTLREIERELELQSPTMTAATVFELNTVREAAKMKRLELEASLIQSRARFVETAPEVQDLVQAKASLDELIDASSERVERQSTEALNAIHQALLSRQALLRTELQGTRAALRATEQAKQELQARLELIPPLQTQLLRMDRRYALAQEKLRQLQAKQALAAASVATTRAAIKSMRFVERATPPIDKSWPKLKYLYPAALMGGLMVGLAAALLLTYTSGRVRREHVEGGRGSAPFYGVLEVATSGRPLVIMPPDPSRAS
jgi:uncharacterized protein involved in exopolysaccharide biosynthesis